MDWTKPWISPRLPVISACFLWGTLLLSGCSQGPPYELATVRGAVSIQGRPLTAGKVMFAPTSKGDSSEAGKPAFGLIQPDGSFTLTTYKDNDGAIVGEHWVTIFIPKDSGQEGGTGGIVDVQYQRLPVTRKQVVAAGQDNQIEIQLTSQEAARFGVL